LVVRAQAALAPGRVQLLLELRMGEAEAASRAPVQRI
jgi:hypothetical protein